MKWIEELLGQPSPNEGDQISIVGKQFEMSNGVLRDLEAARGAQAQTRDMFSFKWNKRDTFESEAMQSASQSWLSERYGDLLAKVERKSSAKTRVLDVGCGAGHAAKLLFSEQFDEINYLGVDVSDAVTVAKERIKKNCEHAFFMQADLMSLPFDDGTFDIVLSEGVLHHTPSTKKAIMEISRLVRPGGIFAFYVYKKKAPIREFSDDQIRTQIGDMEPDVAWDKLLPLTKLGKVLGELNLEVEVPENVELLEIPAGKIDIQRLFYWYIVKMYYRPEFTIDEMNHINFDWFAPKYAFRQTPEQVRQWCKNSGLNIELLKTEEAGITVIARKNSRKTVA